jgi:hypothetical protein
MTIQKREIKKILREMNKRGKEIYIVGTILYDTKTFLCMLFNYIARKRKKRQHIYISFMDAIDILSAFRIKTTSAWSSYPMYICLTAFHYYKITTGLIIDLPSII